MLELSPKHILSNTFEFRTPEQELVELRASAWRERADFDLQGVQYRLYREGRLRGPFVLEREGQVIARAVKPSVWRDRFELDIDGRSYTMRKPSVFSRRYAVFSGDAKVGEIAPAGALTRRTYVHLPPDWPVAVQLFVFWLALVMWNRQAAAAGGG